MTVHIRPSLRIITFVVLCVACAGLAITHTLTSAARVREDESAAKGESGASPEAIAAIAAEPHLLFLQSSGDTFRRVALAPLEPDAPALATDLWCQRVYFSGGRGLCMGKDAFKGGAFIFNERFEVVHALDALGLTSRARVSRDGRFGAVTVFVQGHSYADAGFSTRTSIIDMESGKYVIEDLEEMDIRDNGRPVDAIDRNFWGVTFVPGSTTFYATVGTGGETYLVRGDFATRQGTVLRNNVECPSLSPDGTRVAFKKRVSSGLLGVKWELYVLDLETMVEFETGEHRNIDDQAEWLDNDTLIYYLHDEGPPATIRPDLWTARVDGSEPQRYRTGSFSPAVVNP